MWRHIPGAIALIALASPALSADLKPATSGNLGQVQDASAPVVADRSWTGCYLGGQVGGLWPRSEKWVVRTPGGDHFGESLGSHDAYGWIGGVQAGCDYQLANLVFGIQGDYGWSSASGSHASAQEFGVFYHSKVKSLASVTGRIGYARNRFLAYVKGGVAWESVDSSASTILVGTALTASDTRLGWTMGVGGEYAVTDYLSVFVEYNYYDFGTSTTRFAPRLAGVRPGFLDIEESTSVARVGLNLRFSR